MDIRHRQQGRKWIVEVWSKGEDDGGFLRDFDEPYPEEVYQEINSWCLESLGYHARTAYHIFELRTESDLNWFLLRWL